jgi:hypothetical protein
MSASGGAGAPGQRRPRLPRPQQADSGRTGAGTSGRESGREGSPAGGADRARRPAPGGGPGRLGAARGTGGRAATATAARTPFVVLVVTLLAGGLVSLLLLNSAVNRDSFQLDKLQKETTGYTDEQQQLQQEVDGYSAPGDLERRAQQLGMVPGGNPAFLNPDGTIRGATPDPATAPPAPPSPLPTPVMTTVPPALPPTTPPVTPPDTAPATPGAPTTAATPSL